MRRIFKDVLSAEEARDLATPVSYLSFDDPRLVRILNIVKGIAPVSLEEPSYVRIEQRKDKCDWHTDDAKHMSWCRYSAGMLLTPPHLFSGGGLYFDGDTEPTFHYRDLIVYDNSPENSHRVAKNSGGRRVLLMFMGEL
jgi:hypothetical protein|tara:strand:- start:2522 stop:2938 length:417 start_codon:yes stop_codon:yes gene_type:complete